MVTAVLLTNWKVGMEQGNLNESSTVDLGKASNFPDFSLPRPPTTPTVVHVSRPGEVEKKRKDLPIIMMEQEIMEAINEQSTVIICGETGCGKTTQVPQVGFFYALDLLATANSNNLAQEPSNFDSSV